ncbi:MAG: hypothetical protein K9M57_10095 [Phycisphaerae bacterium]|nr:hypothetical protein [Phycisphaerae bacterium]
MNNSDQQKILRKIRIWLVIFFLGLLFSLHTVFFVEAESAFMAKHFGAGTAMAERLPVVSGWVDKMHWSVSETYKAYPVMAYCMDWLSYACVIFAIFIIGAIKDPVRNIWVIQVYMLACILGALLPFVAGPFREVPLFWRFIDGSFGVMGFFILLFPYRLVRKIQDDQS